MTLDGNPRPPTKRPVVDDGQPGAGSTLPYGDGASTPSAPAEQEAGRKGLRWRGKGQGPEVPAASESGSWNVNPAAADSGAWHAAPDSAAPASSPPAKPWVGPAGSNEVERAHTPYPAVDEHRNGIVLTVGWIEQVLRLSFGSSVDVRVAGVGKSWKVCLDEGQIVDIISSMAHYVRQAMPNGGTLTVHAMPLEIKQGEATARLGVAAGKYVFLGISHMQLEEGAADNSGERPARARVGLDTCLRLVGDLGGTMNVDRTTGGMTAMNIYLPAVD